MAGLGCGSPNDYSVHVAVPGMADWSRGLGLIAVALLAGLIVLIGFVGAPDQGDAGGYQAALQEKIGAPWWRGGSSCGCGCVVVSVSTRRV